MSEWISVKDRLPTDEEMTVMGDLCQWHCIMYWGLEQNNDHRDKPDYYTTGWATPEITREQLEYLATHWMILPPAPTGVMP